MKTAILGAGASGLAAAITLKRECPSMDVILLEKLSEPARKILATGNGRCNLSNKDIDISCYHGDSAILYAALRNFDTEQCISFFHSLGLLTTEEDGRIYPLSMNAATVRNVLLQEAERLGISIRTDFPVGNILPPDGEGNPFILTKRTDKEHGYPVFETADYVLMALGGKADPAHGTDGDGYALLKRLGIHYAPISPSLVALTVEEDLKPLKGLRVQAGISLSTEEKGMVGRERGEVQFTDQSISGIPVLQLSGDASVLCKENESPTLLVNFCPNLPDLAVYEYLRDRINTVQPEEPVLHLFTGLAQDKLAKYLIDSTNPYTHLTESTPVHFLQREDLSRLVTALTMHPFHITGTKKYKDAQVTRGGVPAEELKRGTLESNRIPGLWFSGELLNVDGACGGYNLHFAWGSGILAAKEIANRAAH